jgi:AbrB family looped-hinge helix DNA binding protein
MLARLSSKGQVVIPKAIRQASGLQDGTQFHVRLDEGKIILEPITASALEALYGRYQGVDLLTALETEHHQEIESEKTVRA